MRLLMWLTVVELVLLSMSVGRLGAQQPPDGADNQKATVGDDLGKRATTKLSVIGNSLSLSPET